jgi:hypothetical protein
MTETVDLTEEDRTGEQAAKGCLSMIRAEYEKVGETMDYASFTDWVQEDALCIEIASGWVAVGQQLQPEKFRIVLCTGAPHVEIRGDVDEHGSPANCSLWHNNWYTPMTYLPVSPEDKQLLQEYANCFTYYAGEGE